MTPALAAFIDRRRVPFSQDERRTIDRHRLGCLNVVEQAHCLYWSYANGLIAYVREIAAKVEQYACPIKHGRPIMAPHDRYPLFVDYGDAEGYRRTLEGLRRRLAAVPRPRR